MTVAVVGALVLQEGANSDRELGVFRRLSRSIEPPPDGPGLDRIQSGGFVGETVNVELSSVIASLGERKHDRSKET